jgi:hypothetical protein
MLVDVTALRKTLRAGSGWKMNPSRLRSCDSSCPDGDETEQVRADRFELGHNQVLPGQLIAIRLAIREGFERYVLVVP